MAPTQKQQQLKQPLPLLATMATVATIVVLACFGGAAQAYQYHNFTASEQATFYYYSNASSTGSLQPWVNMAAGVRTDSTPNTTQIVDIITDDGFDVSALIQAMEGAVAIVALCIIFTILSFLTCAFFYCCRACGLCGGSEPRAEPYTKKEKRDVLIVLVVALIMCSIGAIIGIYSSNLIAQGVTGVGVAADHTLNDINNLPSEIVTVVDNMLLDLNNTIQTIIDNIENVPTSFVNGSLSPLIANVTIQIQALQAGFDKLQLDLTNMNATATNTSDAMQTLLTDYYNFQVMYNNLTATHTTPSGETWQFTTECFPTQDIYNSSNTVFPDSSNLLNYTTTFNLTAELNNMTSHFDNLTAAVLSEVDSSIGQITSTIDPLIQSVQTQVNQLMNNTIDPIFNEISGIKSTMDSYLQPGGLVYVSNYYRNVGMSVLFSIIWIVMILAILGLVMRKSYCLTCGSILSFTLMWLFWIFCLFQYIIAVPLGLVCSGIQNEDIMSIIPSSLSSSSINDTLNDFYMVINECTQPDGNIANLTIMGYSMQYYINELPEKFNSTIDQLNLDSLVDNINIADQIPNANFTASLNLVGYESTLQSLSSTNYDGPIDSIQGNLTNIGNNVTTLLTAMQLLTQNPPTLLTPLCLTCNPTSDPTGDCSSGANQSYYDVLNLLLKINNTDIPQVNTYLNQLKNQSFSLQTDANTTIPLIDDLTALTNNITAVLVTTSTNFINNLKNTVLPAQIAFARQFVNTVVDDIIGLAACYPYGQDYMAAINSICVLFLGGLDAVWWACGYMGFFLVLLVVGLTMTAKRVLLATPKDDAFEEGNANNYEMELTHGNESAQQGAHAGNSSSAGPEELPTYEEVDAFQK